MQRPINMHKGEKEPIDYLVIGHITKDLAESGYSVGGTAVYSSLTAQAFGLRTAILTSSEYIKLPYEFKDIQMHRKNSSKTTTFENVSTSKGRKQFVHEKAENIESEDIPEPFLSASILHLGPIAQDVDPGIIGMFPDSFIGITPQGWMRCWNESGLVRKCNWQAPEALLNRTDAVVFSTEDVQGDEGIITELSQSVRITAVTEGYLGARIYWNGDVRSFSAPDVPAADATGAGDIFAAVFFIRLARTKDPWEAGSLAVKLASLSVTRPGLKGIPTLYEIQTTMIETI